jgi:hypothetical protein
MTLWHEPFFPARASKFGALSVIERKVVMQSPLFFQDYRWVKDGRRPTGRPVGVGPLDPPQIGVFFFKFIRLADGDRVEQYNQRGRFVRIVHDPADGNRGTRKLRFQDKGITVAAVTVDDRGVVITREAYSYLSDPAEPLALVKAEVYNADGRLLETHMPRRVGPAAQDIHVTDGLGKLKVIIHQEELDKPEPVKGREEWPE